MNLNNRVLRTIALALSTVAVTVGAVGAADATPAVANDAPFAVAAVKAPTAPRSPTATAGNTRVKLTWLAPLSTGGATINKYAVQRARHPGGPWKRIATTTTRRFTATGLTNGTRYYFRIRAHNAAGWGPYSTIVTAAPRTRPTAPRSPAATPGNTTVELAWLTPSSNGGATIDKYAVQRATSAIGPWKTIVYPTTRSYTAGGLTNGTRYYFRIASHNAAGWGPYSTVVNAVPRTVPSAPRSLLAEDPSDGSVYVNWLPSLSTGGAAIDKYEVTQSNDQVNWTSLGTTTPVGDGENGTTYDGLTNGTTYYFRVRAHNAAGWGPWTSNVSAVPRTVPSAPVGLWSFYNSASSTVDLFWSKPASTGGAAVDHYVLEFSYDPNLPNHWNAWTTTSATYATMGVTPQSPPYWRVKAHNAAGYGPASNVTTITLP